MTYPLKSLITAVLVLFHVPSLAQVIAQTQALNLGTVAVLDNSTVGTISINNDALVQTTGGVRVLISGTPAIFSVTGFDSERRLFITVQANQSVTTTTLFSPEQFIIQSYDSSASITTNEVGDGEFSVGATFATSGSGSVNFRDGVQYQASYSVTVNY